jgi:hypothetical protein
MLGADIVVAWIKCNRFQKPETFAGITSKGYGAAEFHPPEERHVYQLKF